MRYHIFVKNNKEFITNVDRCIYCNGTAKNIFNNLSKYTQEYLGGLRVGSIEYDKIIMKYFVEYVSCENGISEEEYIIKELME